MAGFWSERAVAKQTSTIMSFGDHLDELRRRVMFALLGAAVIFVVAMIFGEQLLALVTDPVAHALHAAGQPETLLATSPLEGFGAYLKVVVVATAVAGLPWFLYQAWLFIAPGLYANEQRFVYVLMPMSVAMTAIGLACLYFVVLPMCLFFLIDFGAGLMRDTAARAPTPAGVVLPQMPVLDADPSDAPVGAMWFSRSTGQLRVMAEEGRVVSVSLGMSGRIAQQYRVSETIDLILMMGLAFAIAFQVPLVLMLLSWAGLLRPQQLTGYRKQVIFACVVGASLLPTQDPLSLMLLSGILIGLFELGILLMRLTPLRAAALGPAQADDTDTDDGPSGDDRRRALPALAGTDGDSEA